MVIIVLDKVSIVSTTTPPAVDNNVAVVDSEFQPVTRKRRKRRKDQRMMVIDVCANEFCQANLSQSTIIRSPSVKSLSKKLKEGLKTTDTSSSSIVLEQKLLW